MLIAILAAIWVATCSGYDLFRKRVPNGLMAAGWLGAMILRAYWLLAGNGNAPFQVLVTLLIWLLSIGFWLAGWWGAADAKFLMAVTLAFPDIGMLAAMLLANLSAGLFGLAYLRSRPSRASLPAVACLGAGWLAWAALTWR